MLAGSPGPMQVTEALGKGTVSADALNAVSVLALRGCRCLTLAVRLERASLPGRWRSWPRRTSVQPPDWRRNASRPAFNPFTQLAAGSRVCAWISAARSYKR